MFLELSLSDEVMARRSFRIAKTFCRVLITVQLLLSLHRGFCDGFLVLLAAVVEARLRDMSFSVESKLIWVTMDFKRKKGTARHPCPSPPELVPRRFPLEKDFLVVPNEDKIVEIWLGVCNLSIHDVCMSVCI